MQKLREINWLAGFTEICFSVRVWKYRTSWFYVKNSVKSNCLLEADFTKHFSSESTYLVFPHCVFSVKLHNFCTPATMKEICNKIIFKFSHFSWWKASIWWGQGCFFRRKLGCIFISGVVLFTSVSWNTVTQCGNFRIFLSLRFSVKSLLENVEVHKMKFHNRSNVQNGILWDWRTIRIDFT